MSENNTTAEVEKKETENKKAAVGLSPYTVERNGVPLTLSFFKILKGNKKDTQYPAPDVTPKNLKEILTWMGDTVVLGEIATVLKRKFQNIFNQATTKEGGFNEELFIKYAQDFTTAGLKLSEIAIRLDELMAEVSKLVDDQDLSDPAVQVEIKELNTQIKTYKQMREDKQKKSETDPDSDKDAEPSVKA